MHHFPLLFLSSFITCISAAVPALTYRGADFTSLAVTERAGITYGNAGIASPFETVLADHGTNLARIRIWTAGEYGLDNGLALAKRAKAAGMSILIDLHYSDSWADPGKQTIPALWPTDLAGLTQQIRQYTNDVVAAFISNGTPGDMIQIGNEIGNGLLWPAGALWPVGSFAGGNYDAVSQLLHSGVQGARAGSPTIKTVIHLEVGWDTAMVQSWYNGMISPGRLAVEDIDFMGFSFYPYYGAGATFANLKASLTNIVGIYGKDVLVVETDFPFNCSGVTLSENIVPGEVGQSTWVKGIRDVLTSLPGGRGKGIIYWEPSWIGNSGLGSPCWDVLLVEQDGNARNISMNIFNDSM